MSPRTLVWKLHLRSAPERVFAALTTDAGRRSFWAEESVEEPDGGFSLRFITGESARCRVLQSAPDREWEIEYFGTRVLFSLEPDGRGGTDLTLTNFDVPEAEWDEVNPGWLNVLFPLKAYLDFGIDLRSHDPGRTWRDRYVDQ